MVGTPSHPNNMAKSGLGVVSQRPFGVLFLSGKWLVNGQEGKIPFKLGGIEYSIKLYGTKLKQLFQLP